MRVAALFSGCGGLDLGFEKAGYEIVWANDYDKYAVQTYNLNMKTHAICADINSLDLNEIPQHDVLIGGFPCQPFSMMGQEKGFNDTRGTLFFRVMEIVDNQKTRGFPPKVIVLENVRNLLTHDNGKTFFRIKGELNERGYKVYAKLLNSADYGVPQTRNRVFIVCFHDQEIEYEFPSVIPLEKTLQDILEQEVDEKYFLSEKIKKTILSDGSGNYFAKSETDLSIARPLTATMAKMHRACQDNYVTQNGRLRRLTPRECARLQGFSDTFKFNVSDAQAYKQFGNAVTVDVAYAIAKSIREKVDFNND
ncbi:MAG: DNA (cytosine-5-)-methyltransferase [Lachnospiraceae bacterium]|nr:DNA (cytosine-5-)-methyltransferase [Lachnospiraceae bacterium]